MSVTGTAAARHAGERWYVGMDVGGTFTDLVMANSAGDQRVVKVLSNPADPADGVLRAIEQAAADLGADIETLLSRCALFVHGATVATNTVLERKGACVALLATDGFRDAIDIRRGYRKNPWDHRTPFPAPLVPRYLRIGIPGRLDKTGAELIALDEETIIAACHRIRREDVEAVAVCLFNSFLNDEHEQRALAIVRRELPDVWACASADVAPVMGEYERTATAVVNAYVAPRTFGYLERLERALGERGLSGSMLLIQNNGGTASLDGVRDAPATLLLSGPAAGAGALDYYAHATGTGNLISMEIGGTSCDVILMSDGKIEVTDRFGVGGHDLALPTVEIHTVGAGGGTIAGVDDAGLLFVGPAGAGSWPGPAAYGLGGPEPTVTDAQLVLGRLHPGPYAGGAVTLDRERAVTAIETRVAAPLGLDVEQAAIGIIRLLEQNLLQAVQSLSVERGHDPRRFTLVACGGAGPMHGATIGRELGCARVLVPALSGTFCAFGMLHTDTRFDLVRVFMGELDSTDPAVIESVFAELEADGRLALEREGFAPDAIRFRREADLRYLGQQYDVRVPLGDRFQPADATERFERIHQRLFGHIQPQGIVQIMTLRLVAFGALPHLDPPGRIAGAGSPAMRNRRRVYLGEAFGWAEVPVFDGTELEPGHCLEGPLIVDDATTTILVLPGDRFEVDTQGNRLITLATGPA